MVKQVSGRHLIMMIALAGLFLSGCDEDQRLAEMAREAANRQAEQNKEMARQNERIAEATKELVAADAQARQELTTMQKDLRADQAEVGRQRDGLETERQKVDVARKWDQLLAPVLVDFGVLLVIAAALGFCWYLLIGLRREDVTDQTVGEILIQELVSENPLLLPPSAQTMPPVRALPPALNHSTPPAIEDYSQDSTISKT